MIQTLVGVAVGFSFSLFGQVLQRRWMKKDKLQEERRQLVRGMVRHRMDQRELALCINEIPVLFHDDAGAVDLYRRFVSQPEERDSVLSELLVYMCRTVGLPTGSRGDLISGLYVEASANRPAAWRLE